MEGRQPGEIFERLIRHNALAIERRGVSVHSGGGSTGRRGDETADRTNERTCSMIHESMDEFERWSYDDNPCGYGEEKY